MWFPNASMVLLQALFCLIRRNFHRESLCNHVPFVDLLGGLGHLRDERRVSALGGLGAEFGHDILCFRSEGFLHCTLPVWERSSEWCSSASERPSPMWCSATPYREKAMDRWLYRIAWDPKFWISAWVWDCPGRLRDFLRMSLSTSLDSKSCPRLGFCLDLDRWCSLESLSDLLWFTERTNAVWESRNGDGVSGASGKGLLMALIYVLCIAVYSIVTLSAWSVC